MTMRKFRALLLLLLALLAPTSMAACGDTDIEGEVIHGDHGDDDAHGAEADHSDDEHSDDDEASAEEAGDAEHNADDEGNDAPRTE